MRRYGIEWPRPEAGAPPEPEEPSTG
jgi:hypothetical protein